MTECVTVTLPEGSTPTHVDPIACVVLAKNAGPFIEAGLGKFCAFAVRVLEGSAERFAPPPIEFMFDGLQDEPAPVLLQSVNLPHHSRSEHRRFLALRAELNRAQVSS